MGGVKCAPVKGPPGVVEVESGRLNRGNTIAAIACQAFVTQVLKDKKQQKYMNNVL